MSAVSRKVAWALGTHGTYVRTIDGYTWIAEQVPGAEKLDFRGAEAFSADEAFLMSSGPGEQSRIYHTADAGRHWQMQFTEKNPKGFFDSMAFWDRTHGIVLGDPIPDESGKLKFELLLTEDGQNWNPIPRLSFRQRLRAKGHSRRAIRVSPSSGAKIKTSGSLPEAQLRAFFTLLIVGAPGKSSILRLFILRLSMGPTRKAFSRLRSAMPSTAPSPEGITSAPKKTAPIWPLLTTGARPGRSRRFSRSPITPLWLLIGPIPPARRLHRASESMKIRRALACSW